MLLDTPMNPFKRLRRFQHVVNVLAKYGFGDVLTRIRLWNHFNIEKRIFHHEHEINPLTAAQRLRLVLEELGPVFIKLGQVLSTRPDMVPPEIIAELKKLQTSVHFVPVDTIRRIIEDELHQPVETLFESFDDRPLAAASLAQVHRAKYHGKQVVLKVQRPNIAAVAEEDLAIMKQIADLAERYSAKVYLLNPLGLIDEFTQQMRKELDFRAEVNNLRHFKQNFVEDETIHVPEVYPELCSKRVITMEYLDGIAISDRDKLVREGYDLKAIARRGAVLGFKATFLHGFFHADPHPGNILVLPDNVIGLVDYGMMATLSSRDRERLAKLVYFISVRDEGRIARALNELMESEDTIPAEELEPSMSAIVKEYGDLAASEMAMASMLFAMIRAIVSHGAKLRPQLLWLTKSIAIQEEVARSLGADFNLMDLGRPFAQQTLFERMNPLRQPYEIFHWMGDALDLAKNLPYDIGVIVREFRKGRLKIEFEHVGLEPIRQTLERIANRTSLTIIIAALLMSSSVIVLAKVPPFVANIPLLGFLGYVLAIILALMLTVSILFRRR